MGYALRKTGEKKGFETEQALISMLLFIYFPTESPGSFFL